jgi:hypothetical protein
MKKVLIISFVVLILLQRPNILGQLDISSSLVIYLYLFFFLWYLTSTKKKFFKNRVKYFISFIPLSVLFIVHALIYDLSLLSGTINTVILFLIPTVLLFTVFKTKHVKLAIEVLVWFTVIAAISQVISQITLLFIDLPHSTIEVPMGPDKSYILDVVFPFSVIGYGSFNFEFFGIIFPRSFGPFREPGIFQIFIISSYFLLDLIDVRFQWFYKIILFFTLVTTFSTAGFVIFILCYLYKLIVLDKTKIPKAIYVPIILLILYPLFQVVLSSDYSFALNNKLDGKRWIAVLFSIEALKSNPLFGIGMFSNAATYETIGIHLLGLLGQIGLIGFSLFLFPFVYAFKKGWKSYSAFILIPLLLTYLFSQPLHDKSVMFFLLTLSFLVYEYEKTPNKHHNSYLQQ